MNKQSKQQLRQSHQSHQLQQSQLKIRLLEKQKPFLTQRISIVFALAVLFLLTTIFLTSCSGGHTNSVPAPEGLMMINDEGVLPQQTCEDMGLTNKALMLESRYCPHCQKALPVFKQACDETNATCETLDLADDENIKKMYDYGITVQFTPTFVINCNYFVGERSLEEFKTYMEN